jgi:hypothetical protein
MEVFGGKEVGEFRGFSFVLCENECAVFIQ